MVNKEKNQSILKMTLLGLVPLVVLGLVVYSFFLGGPTKIFQSDLPPVEDIHVLNHTLEKDLIFLNVINSGTDDVFIAQVMVRGAFWNHEVSPERNLSPLKTALVTIPFPWNIGEPIEIILLTSSGITFDYEIEVASITPQVSFAALGRFGMLGIYVGVIPVALGICWFPFLRRLKKTAMDFLIYVTVGLLAFLTIDAFLEGFEAAEALPGMFHGAALLILGFIGTYLILLGIGARVGEKHKDSSPGMTIAWIMALGIGFHNFGEGLAIGSAYVLGELSLGALLVIGFTLHNATEGIAIVAPILKEKVKLSGLCKLGLLAGVPTIFGCWIGAFTYSQIWAIFFLGVGAGALAQVIGAILGRRTRSNLLQPFNILGIIMGYLLMYGTGLLVGGS
ncbi:metal transporter [PVC group bacterium]|nr:metal transporter [PVC group bacterium]